MSSLWLVPLALGALGAVGLGVAARWLNRQVEDVQRAMRPLRTGRSRRSPNNS